MFIRSMSRLKQRVLVVFITVVVLVTAVYLYLNYLQENYNSAQWSGERCHSELTSLKYQLNVVTEYKERLDKLLKEAQAAHRLDKERCGDIMESCVAMKQQATICQSQFEDLTVECKKLKADFEKVTEQLDKKTC